ncbi:MAG: amino acid carrier protein, partial [Pricia sp.]|nr:amino acid carrier protein [Pricia sp.]
MKTFITILFVLLGFAAFSQELTVKAGVMNPSKQINDGVVDLQVLGGTPPYTYKWSNQNTPLSSNRAMGLVEGVPYTVIVTDANGNSVTKVYTVET